MPATTPTWGLTYPLGSENPRDGWSTIAASAATLDAELAVFTATLKRITTVPYSSISAAAPAYNTVLNPALPTMLYDTVNADNYSYVNLAAMPAVISVPNTLAPGGEFWITAFFASTVAPVTNSVGVDILAATPTTTVFTTGEADFTELTAAQPAGGMFTLLQGAGSSGFEHYTVLTGFSALTDIVPGYTAFVYWIGDAQ